MSGAAGSSDWPFLHVDLCAARGRAPAVLPASAARGAALPGNLRLQVVGTRDLNVPTAGRVDLSGPNDRPNDMPNDLSNDLPNHLSNARRLLQVTLTDGYREIVALEIARVAALDPRSARVPGTKVLLRGDGLQICDGFALLRPRNVFVLGGVVPHLKRRHEQKMLLLRRDPLQALGATTNATDSGLKSTADASKKGAGSMPPPFEEYDPDAERVALEQEERAMREARIAAAKREAALRGVDPKTLDGEGGAASAGGADTKAATSFAQRHRERKEMEAQAQNKGVLGVKEALASVLRRGGGEREAEQKKTKKEQQQQQQQQQKKKKGGGNVLLVEDVGDKEEGEGDVDDGAAARTRRFGLRGIAASLDLVAAGSVPELVFVIKDINDIEDEARLPVSSTLLLVLLGLAHAKGAPPLDQLWATSKGKKFMRKRVQKLEAALITGAPVTFRVEKAEEVEEEAAAGGGSWQIVNLEQ